SLLFLYHAHATTTIYTLSLHDALPIYRRFDLDAPMVDRVIKFHEEAHEFLTEALKTTGENGALVVEGWDVIVTIIGILQKSGIRDRKSTRLNSSHVKISYAVFCLKKKK